MKFFILILFLINIFYNFSLKRKNIVFVKLEKKFSFVVFIFGLLVLFMTYRFSSRSILDFLLALSSIVLLFSIISSPGIRRDGFNIFMGSTTLIKFAPFDKVKNIKIDSSNDDKVILSLHVFYNSYKLTFDSKYKNEIENLIENFL
ncbi:hypothetical protein HMPREF3023_02945 [Peptoniphilus sp. HMSC075B08]|uniref:hypothetical protein n=1 Tax=Peptoniphilus sp. HMSC075B08 TaxID=1739525 RepID=UPI0008A113A1|nr:hypothetical protein [Peptoniphilus sp. HMSC075B08]OFO61164.1 hypothetical protein HMPREF3023_02945 [Peptoniphilus sp. HMSC075B08]